MDIKDYSQMMRYLTRPRDVVPDPSSMVQGPRNMYAGGQLVSPSVDGLRPGYAGAKFDDPSAGIKVGDDLGQGISQTRVKDDGSITYRVYRGKVKGKVIDDRSVASYADAVAERGKYVPKKKGIPLTKEGIKNENKWKKANPNLNFDDLSQTVKSNIRKTGRTDLGTIGQGKANVLLTGKDSPFYQPLDAKGEKIAKHVYGTTDITDDQRQRINSGQTTMDTKPVKWKEGDISVKSKKGQPVTDVVFPNKEMEKEFIKDLELRAKQPQKAVVDYGNAWFAEKYDISERQVKRAIPFLMNREKIKYLEIDETPLARNIKKRKGNLDITSSNLQEGRTTIAKTKILDDLDLARKVDTAHRVSKAHMAR